MKEYLIEYIDPRTGALSQLKMEAESKTDARDLFYEQYVTVNEVIRITWIPKTNNND